MRDRLIGRTHASEAWYPGSSPGPAANINYIMNKSEGFIPVEGGNIWYKVIGEPKNIPLILLHGGPGYPHDYLEPLEDLATDRQIVFYDQLGCGNSDKTTDPALWTVEQFVKELQQIIGALKLEKYHILGHSWGSALAVAFALTKPKGLISLIFSDPYISTPRWAKDAERLIGLLPQDMQKALKSDVEESEEYKRASKEYYARFVRGIDPYPEACERADKKMNRDLYNYMWGPKEFQSTGTLLDFDPTPRFSEITIPVLLLCGRYDEATPETSKYFQSLLPNAQLKVFEDSAHFPFWNKREEYMQTVQSFLQEVESKHSGRVI